jgi:acyl-CoA synthetase (AMP-forming)/AMP-acid ligase II
MNVPHILRRARRFHGGRTAMYEGDHAVSYDQFFSRVMRGAQALRVLGIRRGDRVAVLMLNRRFIWNSTTPPPRLGRLSFR